MQLNLLTTLALLGVASQHVAAAPRPDPKPEPVPEPAPKYDASVRDSSYSHDSGIVTALFRDINDAESRAEFKIGKWAFAGFAAYPIQAISQDGHKAVCTYTGATSGAFKIMGAGKVKVSPPQTIKDVDCYEL